MAGHDFTLRMALVAALALAAACKPEIGDDCDVSTDCSNAGDRLCDTTQPGGYCTIFNCEPGSCPDEAICVAFKGDVSRLCPNPQGEDRLLRTFCLRRCDGDGDCRSGYSCIDMGSDNPWGATVAEYGSVNGKVCIVPYSGALLAESPNLEVCTGTDAGFGELSPFVPEGGMSTMDAASDSAADSSIDASMPDANMSDAGDAASDSADQ